MTWNGYGLSFWRCQWKLRGFTVNGFEEIVTVRVSDAARPTPRLAGQPIPTAYVARSVSNGR